MAFEERREIVLQEYNFIRCKKALAHHADSDRRVPLFLVENKPFSDILNFLYCSNDLLK